MTRGVHCWLDLEATNARGVHWGWDGEATNDMRGALGWDGEATNDMRVECILFLSDSTLVHPMECAVCFIFTGHTSIQCV